MKIIYFGSSSPLSLLPLKALLKSHHTIAAVVVQEDISSDFNVVSPNTIKSLAFNNSIPVLNYNEQTTNLVTQLKSINADLIIVSCFARHIPYLILSMANLGGINLHPSLLPLYRGPDPIFWQYRDGVENFGVTLHQLTDEFDAGDIISSKKVKLADGLSIEEVTQQLATIAADLITVTLQEIEQNNTCRVKKQNQDLASYQSLPVENDFAVNVSWTAKRIYNFINAFKATNVIFICDIYGRIVKLVSAKSYQIEPYPGMDGDVVLYKGNTVIFACENGFIECEFKD